MMCIAYASASLPFLQMDDELDVLASCPVCMENYNREEHVPKLLRQCGHSVCEECVRQIANNGSLQCPTCRKSVPLDSANSLNSNYDLLGE